jgi:hypothetical protein
VNSPHVSSLDFNDLAASAENCLTELDARAPTPPNHLKAILAALASIPEGRPQFVRTRTEPVELLRVLMAQGVSADAWPLPDGTWRAILRRPSAGTARAA